MATKSNQVSVWRRVLHACAMVAGVFILATFFSQVEINIEGGAGWAANLPTWRIEQHWLLDWFWGG
ncbi:MAG TPA: hypothetical protein PLQ34_10140, partial [Ferrovaceae bacterium]|nr:hypothetical protein [Ferrovaceae bacterium]